MKQILMMVIVVLTLASVTGCRNTARGVGKDIEKAGDKIQEKTR